MSSRFVLRTFAAAFSATLVLTGCGPASAPTQTDAPPPPAPAPDLAWQALTGDEGAALVLIGPGDRPVFHLACLRAPARMTAIAYGFTIIGSEERLTLGIDDEAWGLVADTLSEEPGVRGEAAIDPALLERMPRTIEISAIYGAQQGGPWPAPDRADLTAFAEACRAIAAEAGGA